MGSCGCVLASTWCSCLGVMSCDGWVRAGPQYNRTAVLLSAGLSVRHSSQAAGGDVLMQPLSDKKAYLMDVPPVPPTLMYCLYCCTACRTPCTTSPGPTFTAACCRTPPTTNCQVCASLTICHLPLACDLFFLKLSMQQPGPAGLWVP